MRSTIHRWVHWVWSYITPLHLVLIPMSWAFAIACNIRRKRLTSMQNRLPIPVIVIGNISVGGNGKTTMVILLAKALSRKGHKVGIISRGYRRRYPKTTILVDHDMGAEIIGDEARMIWKQTGCLIGISTDRTLAARLLHEAKCEIILSDDGLQRYDLYRDLEIAVSARNTMGNKQLLPAGPLREKITRLHECDYSIDLIEKKSIHDGHQPESSMYYQLSEIERLDRQVKYQIDEFPKDRSYQAICALGNAQGFFGLLQQQGLNIEALSLPDHDKINDKLLQERKKNILISEKDATKIQHLEHLKHIWVVKITPSICQKTLESIIQSIEHRLNAPKTSSIKKHAWTQ